MLVNRLRVMMVSSIQLFMLVLLEVCCLSVVEYMLNLEKESGFRRKVLVMLRGSSKMQMFRVKALALVFIQKFIRLADQNLLNTIKEFENNKE